jgi:hypothetical protein
LPPELLVRLGRVAAANSRTVEAEAERVLVEHVKFWEDKTRHDRGTPEIANYASRTSEVRRLEAEAAREANAAALRQRRIDNVRRLANWTEIAEPEERRGGLIYDPATGDSWRPYRGIAFNRGEADPCPHDPIAPRAFCIQDGEVVAFEPAEASPARSWWT